MQIRRNIHKINANAPDINNNSYLKGRIGFWALVIEVNSRNNTVTVVSDTGYELKNIPVVSILYNPNLCRFCLIQTMHLTTFAVF